MTIDQIDNNLEKDRRIKDRRTVHNRRTSVRFGDVLGRRKGTERREVVHTRSGR